MVSGAGGGIWSDRPISTTRRYCLVLATEPEGRLATIVDFTFNLGAGRLQSRHCDGASISGTGWRPGRSCAVGSMAAGRFYRDSSYGERPKSRCCRSDNFVPSSRAPSRSRRGRCSGRPRMATTEPSPTSTNRTQPERIRFTEPPIRAIICKLPKFRPLDGNRRHVRSLVVGRGDRRVPRREQGHRLCVDQQTEHACSSNRPTLEIQDRGSR